MLDDNDFHVGEVAAQERWQTTQIWDSARRTRLLMDHIPEPFHERISNAPFFFIATSDNTGTCDCSFKGGGPGIINIIDSKRLAFPDFDGNGAFMSLGNILKNHHLGMLFIDFSDGARLRVNGRASIHDDGPIKELFPDQPRVVLVEIDQVVPNCPAYIPRLVAVEEQQ
ncbi:MAG: pyridoxamine 5'-phosphate oxidase [Gammaproteobacteria bacterium]|nr:pyridoxamine 5'-phosphate oxidase [Gammaproteobacteria bacterium]